MKLFLALFAAVFFANLAHAAPFDFSAPPGPKFSEEEKAAQRERGKTVLPLVQKAFAAGADSVTIAPGEYRFGKESWGPDGPIYPLEFRGLRRDAARQFRIIARGATFWFDLPPDQAPTAHFALGFVDCSHISLEGATLDRDPRGNMEGRITLIDEARNRLEIEATRGSFIPTTFNDKLEQRLLPFNADGTLCAALYGVQQMAPARLGYRSVESGTQPGRYWVNLPEKSQLLKVNADPAWRAAYGEAGTLQVGDGLSLVYSTTLALSVIRCEQMRFVEIRNHITKGCVRELDGAGGHLWQNCYFGPRPGTNQWQGADGILTGCMERGSAFDGLTLLHTSDDMLDIHGNWGYIEATAGRTITLKRDHQMRAARGDVLNFYDRQSGEPLGNATVENVETTRLTLDRDAGPLGNAVAENPRRQNAGWEIRNSTFTDCYQRLLVQGGNGGTLANSRFVRTGHGIQLSSNFFTGNEGGICRDIQILDNYFEDVAIYPGGVTLEAGFQSLNHNARTPLLDGLVLRGNSFVAARPTLRLSLVAGATFENNRLVFQGATPDAPPLEIKRSRDIVLRGNRLEGNAPGRLAALGEECVNVVQTP